MHINNPPKVYQRFACVVGFCLISSVTNASSISELVNSALASHPSVAAAQADIRVAKASVEAAEWQFYPTAGFNVEYVQASSSDTSYVGDPLVTTLTVDQPVWNWGRVQAGVDIASAGEVVAKAKLRQQQWSIAEQVVNAYGSWYGAYKTQLAWQRGLTIHTELLQQVENRVNQGVSAVIDLSLAQGRVASTEAEYLTSQADADIALYELVDLVSTDLSHEQLAQGLELPELDISNASLLHLLAQNIDPSVEQARAEIALAEYELIEKEAGLMPAVYLRAEHQLNSFSNANSGNNTRVFLGLSGSTGAGLSMLSASNGAKAKIESKKSAFNSVIKSRRQQITSLIAKIRSLTERVAMLEQALTTTSSVSDSYKRQFLAGRKSWQEVMNSAREQVQMEVQIVDLQAASNVAKWRLALYTSGLNLDALNLHTKEN